MKGAFRGALPWLCLTLIMISALWWVSARRASVMLERARAFESEAEREGMTALAIERYQWAARSYAPFAEAPQEASRALWRLAERAQKSGDEDTELKARERLRGLAWSTEGVVSPFSERLEELNERIALLRARDAIREAKRLGAPHPDQAKLKAELLRALHQDPRPPFSISLLLAVGLIGSLVSLLLFVFKGLTPRLELRVEGRLPLLSFSLCVALWLSALALTP